MTTAVLIIAAVVIALIGFQLVALFELIHHFRHSRYPEVHLCLAVLMTLAVISQFLTVSLRFFN